eukprot:PhM_4_TR19028/c0_g1_i1/m.8879
MSSLPHCIRQILNIAEQVAADANVVLNAQQLQEGAQQHHPPLSSTTTAMTEQPFVSRLEAALLQIENGPIAYLELSTWATTTTTSTTRQQQQQQRIAQVAMHLVGTIEPAFLRLSAKMKQPMSAALACVHTVVVARPHLIGSSCNGSSCNPVGVDVFIHAVRTHALERAMHAAQSGCVESLLECRRLLSGPMARLARLVPQDTNLAEAHEALEAATRRLDAERLAQHWQTFTCAILPALHCEDWQSHNELFGGRVVSHGVVAYVLYLHRALSRPDHFRDDLAGGAGLVLNTLSCVAEHYASLRVSMRRSHQLLVDVLSLVHAMRTYRSHPAVRCQSTDVEGILHKLLFRTVLLTAPLGEVLAWAQAGCSRVPHTLHDHLWSPPTADMSVTASELFRRTWNPTKDDLVTMVGQWTPPVAVAYACVTSAAVPVGLVREIVQSRWEFWSTYPELDPDEEVPVRDSLLEDATWH